MPSNNTAILGATWSSSPAEYPSIRIRDGQYPAVSRSILQYPAVSQYPGSALERCIALRPQSHVQQRDARQQLGGEGLSQLSSLGKEDCHKACARALPAQWCKRVCKGWRGGEGGIGTRWSKTAEAPVLELRASVVAVHWCWCCVRRKTHTGEALRPRTLSAVRWSPSCGARTGIIVDCTAAVP